MRPTTQKQASRRAEIEARRYDALQLKIAGYSDREIARRLGVGVSTSYNDVKNVLEALAREHAEEAANLRSLLIIRYEELFHAYYDQAISGDAEATKICICSR
jgi:DNA-binding CsgD family transcriptional regulator